ncbi:hypothetical protein RclHR1_00720029 [Rhizophagus clarus]|uniref:MIR domain-containing protein n=1 Tax=Rhizophagus clarus TaxID=94130 RepID=A0A2Z6SBB6_9GLOM|nr:hypothetical protein RclHR1_00720029 [Rhizophagus clarus]GES94891.1 hypothetical protein GLOIN_2v1494576 [Rhizophagus clarus]
MELIKYTGTIHPEEWLKQIQIHCYLKGIEDEQKILKICKLMIDSTIIIPKEINSFDDLIKLLKSHTSFNIFKDSCKRKLQVMKYDPKKEENYTATFLSNFRSLCNDAEIINNPQEIKNLLLNTYSSNKFFENEFIKRSKDPKLDNINKIVNLFNNIVFDELNVIKFDSLITLKHVPTGKYLSSRNVNYQTGSLRKMVFANEKSRNSDALWFITKINHHTQKKEPYQQNMICYDDEFYLRHKETNNLLWLSYNYKSPSTGHSEAFCNDVTYSARWQIINVESNDRTQNDLYVKSKDIINLKLVGEQQDLFLRSHDFAFTINGKTFQEVVGSNDRIGANDKWCIELV